MGLRWCSRNARGTPRYPWFDRVSYRKEAVPVSGHVGCCIARVVQRAVTRCQQNGCLRESTKHEVVVARLLAETTQDQTLTKSLCLDNTESTCCGRSYMASIFCHKKMRNRSNMHVLPSKLRMPVCLG